jgi:hypothetical protein
VSKQLKFYDGYFMHHITVFAKEVGGLYYPIVHKSGTLPEHVRTGERQRDTWGRAMPLNWLQFVGGCTGYKTADEAVIAAEAHCNRTTGQWCKDYHYRAGV